FGGSNLILGLRAPGFGELPVFLKGFRDAASDGRVANDDSHFPALIQLNFPQALTAYENVSGVADDGTGVQADLRQLVRMNVRAAARKPAEDPDPHAGLG